MYKKSIYRPDYSALYPGIEISDEVLAFLKKADRKIEYQECDLKRDRVLKSVDGKTILDDNGLPTTLPEREVSLEKLMDEDWDFPSSEQSPEDSVIGRFGIKALHDCLDLLESDERELIDALFFSNSGDGMAEREYSVISGIPQKTINDRKRRIFEKLKKLLQK